MGTEADSLQVEVVYALPAYQWVVPCRMPAGSTVLEAVQASGILSQLPEPPAEDDLLLGVFGRRCAADQPLREGDRVEIYRPLKVDPMEQRRRRARGG